MDVPAPVLPDSIKQRLFRDAEQTEDQVRAEQVGQWVNCDLRTFDYSVLGQ
jgi:mRNA (2'-O-methyladenosine-N6-)-methyltransferase